MDSESAILNAPILIVEDEPINAEILRAVLENVGFHNIALEGDSRNSVHRYRDVGPHLIILDLHMPHRSGFEVLADLRDAGVKPAAPPVLIYTADATLETKRRALSLGATDFITKPCDSIEISLRARNLIRAFHLHLSLESQNVGLEAAVRERTHELETANERLKEFDQLKTEFVATASHEMRTPLTVIREYASLLRDGVVGNANPEETECLEAVLRNCDRLSILLDNLLDLHKIEAGRLSMRRNRAAVIQVASVCYADFVKKCQSKRQTIELHLPDEEIDAIGDSDLLNQVFVNLIGNAHKFTPNKGRIDITVSKGAGSCLIDVEDSGKGIPPDRLEQVFEPFRQIDREEGPGIRGTGLGLTISKKIIEMHRGAVRVQSEQGKGTKFTIEIPIWQDETGFSAFVEDRLLDSIDSNSPMSLLMIKLVPTSSHATAPALERVAKIVANAVRGRDDVLVLDEAPCIIVALNCDMHGASQASNRIAACLSKEKIADLKFKVVVPTIEKAPSIIRLLEGDGWINLSEFDLQEQKPVNSI